MNQVHGDLSSAMLSDGWSGHQKTHILNVLVATPRPFFLNNISTKADRVTGEYQVCVVAARARCTVRDRLLTRITAPPCALHLSSCAG